MNDLDIFKNVFVPNIQGFSRLSYTIWKNSNPGEAARWEPYRDAILAGESPTPPSMTTKFGKALVAAGQLVQQEAPPPPPPPPTGTSPVGLMAFGGSLGHYTAHADDYSLVVFDQSDYSTSTQFAGKTLVYTSPIIINQSNQVAGLNYSDIASNEWLLDTAGNPMHAYNSNSYWIPDFSLQTVRDRMVTKVLQLKAAHPTVDGIEIDNIVPNPAYWNPSRLWPAKFPNGPAWRQGLTDWFADVGVRLKAQGIYMLPNSSGYSQESGYDAGTFSQMFWTQLASSGGVSGFFAECWLQNPNNLGVLMDNSNPGSYLTSWAGWQGLVATCNAAGVDFFGCTAGPNPATDVTTARHFMRYMRGSFLLDWNGRSGAVYYDAVSGFPGGLTYTNGIDAWDPTWTSTTIGAPTAAKTTLASNVWFRRYANGWVVVNASTSSWSGTIDGSSYSVPARDSYVYG